MDGFQAAAANADWTGAKNFAVNLIDQPGDDSLADRLADVHPAAEGPEGPDAQRAT